MPYVDKEKQRQRNKEYHKKWYANPENRERRKQQARVNNQKTRARNKEFVRCYKVEHGCSQCPEHRPHCLDFHHSSGQKEANVSRMAGNTCDIEKLKAEIAKCVLLCKNCHADLHEQMRQKQKHGKVAQSGRASA